jgi:DNA-binding CsgD family transcriptional regulator
MAAILSDRDVGRLLRVAGEVGELPEEPHVRRRHILDGLLALVGGCGAVCVEMDPRHVRDSGWATSDAITVTGAISSQADLVRRYVTGGMAALDPCVPRVLRRRGAVVTLRRADVIEESLWQRSEHYNELRRPHGLGEALYGTLAAPDGRRLKVTFQRGSNDRPFSDRDARLVQVFNENLGRLYGSASRAAPRVAAAPPSKASEGTVASLAPRLRPVLRRLLAGDSEKQAARQLGLSPHTVHQYTKALYRAFGVNSRGELLAQFVVSE